MRPLKDGSHMLKIMKQKKYMYVRGTDEIMGFLDFNPLDFR